MKLVLIFSLLLWSAQASASPADREKDIAEALASMNASADEATAEMWRVKPPFIDGLGLNLSAVRSIARWLMPAYSLGMCQKYTRTSDKLDWLQKADGLVIFLDGQGVEFARALQEEGEKQVAEGAKEETPRAAFCDIELEAIRRFTRRSM